jgi:hypothetical protein
LIDGVTCVAEYMYAFTFTPKQIWVGHHRLA